MKEQHEMAEFENFQVFCDSEYVSVPQFFTLQREGKTGQKNQTHQSHRSQVESLHKSDQKKQQNTGERSKNLDNMNLMTMQLSYQQP